MRNKWQSHGENSGVTAVEPVFIRPSPARAMLKGFVAFIRARVVSEETLVDRALMHAFLWRYQILGKIGQEKAQFRRVKQAQSTNYPLEGSDGIVSLVVV